jgi:hypothetical protein
MNLPHALVELTEAEGVGKPGSHRVQIENYEKARGLINQD